MMRTLIAVTLLLVLGLARTADASSSCAWQVFKPPNASTFNFLNAVDAISATDVWAGGKTIGKNGDAVGEIEHFDGAQWTSSKMPTLDSGEIEGIAHSSSSDVWAVGFERDKQGIYSPTILHWTGSAWRRVKFPEQGQNGLFEAILRVGDAMYAAGNINTARPLVERFDGKKWVEETAYQPPSGRSVFHGIAGVSENSLWAGGFYNGGGAALIEKRDPTSHAWMQVPNDVGSYIDSMSARSDKEVWAVGAPSGPPFVARWNGKKWKLVPYNRGGSLFLWGVNATAMTGYTWVAGFIDSGSARSTAVVDRYAAGQWEQTPIVQVGTWGTETVAVAPVPGSANVWAVGGFSVGDSVHMYNLAELWNCPSGAR